jgi:hypothetical protein
MTVTLPTHKKDELVAELHYFAQKNHHWSLCEFQRLVGWCEWSFNVFPLLKPGLLVLYDKIQGKTDALLKYIPTMHCSLSCIGSLIVLSLRMAYTSASAWTSILF